VNVVTVKGCSPLLVAVKYNSIHALRLLLKDRRVELNTTDWKVSNLTGSSKALRLLLKDRRVELNTTDWKVSNLTGSSKALMAAPQE
jgi:hypothetical protein